MSNQNRQRCPVCGKVYTERPAVSRKDGKTNICPECGIREAIEAMAQSHTLDGVILAPDNKMVDLDHLHIATAWKERKKALVSYDDMQDRHDTLMRRWEGMIETIRKKIDAGTLTIENSQLLDALNLPHGYDKRIPAVQDSWQGIAPLAVEERN